MGKSIYFFSDVHLGASTPEKEQTKEKYLFQFIDMLKENAEAVYILGDLFDFWFEYKYVIPKHHFHVICKLGELSQNTDITYIGGNHDFWVGNFFENKLNIRYSENPIIVTHNGYTIFLHHGDGLLKNDVGYRFLRKILRNPINISLFRLVHPDLGHWIANLVSQTSRKHTTQKEFYNARTDMVEFAQDKIDEGNDVVILAHTHTPVKVQLHNGIYLNTGDWINKFSYIELTNGEFNLNYFNYNE